jgi:hypothetical protein
MQAGPNAQGTSRLFAETIVFIPAALFNLFCSSTRSPYQLIRPPIGIYDDPRNPSSLVRPPNLRRWWWQF